MRFPTSSKKRVSISRLLAGPTWKLSVFVCRGTKPCRLPASAIDNVQAVADSQRGASSQEIIKRDRPCFVFVARIRCIVEREQLNRFCAVVDVRAHHMLASS